MEAGNKGKIVRATVWTGDEASLWGLGADKWEVPSVGLETGRERRRSRVTEAVEDMRTGLCLDQMGFRGYLQKQTGCGTLERLTGRRHR